MSGNSNPPGTYTITLVPPVLTCAPGMPQRAHGPFAGMQPAALQTALTNAQQALIAVSSGTQPVQVNYAEGQGHRQVTYTRANADGLRQLIRELQMALGTYRRRALGVRIG